MQRKHGQICGSIKVVRAAAVAASLTTAACQDIAPTRMGGIPLPPAKDQARNPDHTLGEIAVPPQEKPVQEIRLPGKIYLPEQSKKEKGE